MKLFEIEKELGIPHIGVNQAKRLWQEGSMKFKDVFHFDVERLAIAFRDKKDEGIEPVIIYIHPFSFSKQRKFFAYKYFFGHSNILDKELEIVPKGGYYLFYNIRGVDPEKISKKVFVNFSPASLAVASQGLINYFHYFKDYSKVKEIFSACHFPKFYTPGSEESFGLKQSSAECLQVFRSAIPRKENVKLLMI